MGVVHKLRDDVVEFILAAKKADPDISVRKLSSVVLQKFQVVVSKSSVGSVLKNAHLNSPVGRHGSSDDEETSVEQKSVGKFKIPEQKKKQIFPSHKVSVDTPPVKNLKIEVKPPIKPAPVLKAVIVKPVDKKPALAMSNLEIVEGNRGTYYKNAGMIFLKAAEWDLAGGSLLSKVFYDEIGSRFGENSELLAESLLFPECGPIASIGRGSRRESIKSLDPQAYASALAAVNAMDNCGLKIAVEIDVLLRGVTTIKIYNKNGAVLAFNIKGELVEPGNVQSGAAAMVSVQEAVRTFGINLVNNVHSAVFHSRINLNKINEAIGFLIPAFAPEPQQGLREVIFEDIKGAELAKYDYFPVKKRNFILAVWNWKELWPGATCLRGTKSSEALSVLGKGFTYHSIGVETLGLSAAGLTAVAVYSTLSPTEEPMAVILANTAGEGGTAKAVLDFLLSWPGLGGDVSVAPPEKSDDFFSVLKTMESETTLPQCLTSLKKLFDLWARFRFLAKEQFYALPGYIQDDGERVVVVTLDTSSGYEFTGELKKATSAFNNRIFCDFAGRRIELRSTPYSAK